MGYTQVALEDKILEMYPEIRNLEISPRIRFDDDKNVWFIKLKKGDKEYEVCLEKEDADACMDNKYCETFGTEIKKVIKNF
jgi:hypothetical protein